MGIYGYFLVGTLGMASFLNGRLLANTPPAAVEAPALAPSAWYETERGDTQKIELINRSGPNGPCAKGTVVEFSPVKEALILSCAGFNGTRQTVQQLLVRSQMGWHIRQKVRFIQMGKTILYTEPEPTFYHRKGDVGARVDPRSEMWAKGPGRPSPFDNRSTHVDINEGLFPPLDQVPAPMPPEELREVQPPGGECLGGKAVRDGIGGCAIDV